MMTSKRSGKATSETAKDVQSGAEEMSPGFYWLLSVSLCLVVALVVVNSLYTSEPRSSCDVPVDYNRYFGSRSPYNDVRGNELGKEYKEHGCEAQQLYMVIRHASRYPYANLTMKMNKKLPKLRESIFKHAENGTLCPLTLSALKHWKTGKYPEKVITPTGSIDMFRIGLRVFNAYPGLFNFNSLLPEDLNNTLEVQHTWTENVVQSARSLIKGLLYRAHSDELLFAANDSLIVTTKYRDHLICPSKGCKKFFLNKHLNSYSPENFERVKLVKSLSFTKMLRRLETTLGLPKGTINERIAFLMSEACMYGTELYGSDIWCPVLGVDGLKLYEYMNDIRYYYRYGYGNPVAYEPLCIMVKDFMRTVRDLMSGKSEQRVHIRVGHSGTIVSLLTRLGFLNGDRLLGGDDYTRQTNRKWKMSSINPFSSNVAFVISKCGNERYLRVYLNEREVELPGCGSPCPLTDMFKILEPLTENCNYRAVCDIGSKLDNDSHI